LRMDVEAGEINRLYLPTAGAIHIKPAITGFQRGADGWRPVMRRCGVPSFDDRRATVLLHRAGPGRSLQPSQMSSAPMRCTAHGSLFVHALERASVPIAGLHLLGGLLRRGAAYVQAPQVSLPRPRPPWNAQAQNQRCSVGLPPPIVGGLARR
jgi:hypothetical protein